MVVIQKPKYTVLVHVLELVANPKFSFMELTYENPKGLQINISRNELMYTLYYLEMYGHVYRKKRVLRNAKRYFLTQSGKTLYKQLRNGESNKCM